MAAVATQPGAARPRARNLLQGSAYGIAVLEIYLHRTKWRVVSLASSHARETLGACGVARRQRANDVAVAQQAANLFGGAASAGDARARIVLRS